MPSCSIHLRPEEKFPALSKLDKKKRWVSAPSLLFINWRKHLAYKNTSHLDWLTKDFLPHSSHPTLSSVRRLEEATLLSLTSAASSVARFWGIPGGRWRVTWVKSITAGLRFVPLWIIRTPRNIFCEREHNEFEGMMERVDLVWG